MIRDYTVQFFESKFNGAEQPINESLFIYDHECISEEESILMDVVPSVEEIRRAVYDLGVDSAPGPDGFSGCFYRHCWDIIHQDLINAITYCWQHKLIPQGSNSSLLIFLVKVRGVNTLRNFRPIGLSNFFFKIFTKILATRLGGVLDKLVSEEQVTFMKGRNIHENISVASEMVNELKCKRKDGNVGLKLNISQAFDTGNMKSLNNLLSLLGKYQAASGQTVCRLKSKVYYGGNSMSRCRTITDLLGMEVSTFPDRYLVVKIMPGVVKYCHICNVIDKIKKQLAVWKGRLLSFQDRMVLINSVIAIYLIHNRVFYKWPRKFIDQCERAIHSFLWSGDSDVRRKFVVAYDKVCCPMKEGGLGISKLVVTNKALLMKLWWNIQSSKKKWARFLYAKYTTRKGKIKKYGVNYSIHPGIKQIYKIVDSNTKVLLGDGRSNSLYFDIWYGYTSIAEIIGEDGLDCSVKVSDFLINNEWVIPDAHLHNLLRAGVILNNFP
ncbi:uncharacterized protein LOC113279469 [Papaver somniferum]|uniref:uncharacterized protein LOC113279469 n=1 Tax=Papaver somniferum TaxID=3469 RepID=UPI000E6F4EC8|nr:uncharacterized protein LOC113279469 [Papaver somniferum]